MPSDPEKFRHFQVLLTPKEWNRLKAEAYAREISAGELIRRALSVYLNADKHAETISK